MTSPESSLRNLIGLDFGPYRLTRRLGVGGMAETYEAIRRGPSGFAQRVCLKLVLPFFAEDESFIELFQREARLAATLRHSNIVGVIDFGEIEGRAYMALELVDGPDLRILLDQQPGKKLAPDSVTLLGLELARALEHAHQPRSASPYEGTEAMAHGIVHRDLSPSNVLISRQGEVMLTDFGVAKAMSGTSRKQSAVKGKIPYMSPEQLRAETLDGRADLFALGVVLYEALAGERPYEGAHDPATIMLILDGNRPKLQTLAPEAPEALCTIIDSLVEPDPDARPVSAAALIELLDELAPSPRTRRRLAALAGAAERPTFEDASTQVSSIQGTEPTRSQSEPLPLVAPDARSHAQLSVPPQSQPPQASVAPAAASSAPGPQGVTDPKSFPPVRGLSAGRWTRRDVGRVVAGALLALGGLTGAGVAWWRSQQEGQADREPAANPTTVDSTPAPAAEATDLEPNAIREARRDERQEERREERSEVEPAAAPAAPTTPEPSAEQPAAQPPPPAPAEPDPARLTVVVFPWGKVWINGKLRGAAPLQNKALPPGRYKVSVGGELPIKSETVRLRAGERKTLRFDLTK